MGLYFFGQVVIVSIDDGRGGFKERPALVISSDQECDAGNNLWVLAITRGIQDPSPSYHFVIHDRNTRDPTTGLTFPCVVKCNWFREIPQNRVIKRIGHMPDDLLKSIVEAFDRLFSDDSFEDWQ